MPRQSRAESAPGARIRTDWERAGIRALHDKPFNDLLYMAERQHRAVFDPNPAQLSTRLNSKRGGCPEDRRYCSQSARHQTGLQNQKLLDQETLLAAARRARAIGAERFCMSAACFFGEALLTTPNADMQGDAALFSRLGIAAGANRRDGRASSPARAAPG